MSQHIEGMQLYNINACIWTTAPNEIARNNAKFDSMSLPAVFGHCVNTRIIVFPNKMKKEENWGITYIGIYMLSQIYQFLLVTTTSRFIADSQQSKE